MKRFLDYIRRQDKVKLLIYLYGFSFFLVINNVFGNIYTFSLFQHFELSIICIHCKVPINIYTVSEVLLFLIYKFSLFLLLIRLLKNPTKLAKYTSEILIIFFLFDLGFLASQVIDFFDLTPRHQLWRFCSSPQTLLTPMLGWPVTTLVSLAWTIVLFKALKHHGKLNFDFLLKRSFVIFFSVGTFNITGGLIYRFILQPMGIHFD